MTSSDTVSARERVYRARRIGTTFGRVYLGIRAHRFIATRLRPSDMPDRWSRFNQASAQSIYDAAIELRGLILKGCQFLGARADVFPPEYVEVLSRLQDRVPPHRFAVVRRCVERELACKLEDVFESFSRRPIASASLAQVHEARLLDGRRVAVKVQYPEIEALVRSDLSNLRVLFRAVDWLESDMDLMPLIDELATYVPRELDFENEGRNAEKVAGLFTHRSDIAIPEIHWDLTTRRVLTMEFMEGIKITDTDALREAGLDVDRVAQTLVEAFCEQILTHGVFHADPHPGNLLVRAAADGSPELVLLDFGLTKDLPPKFREGVLGFIGALLIGDVDRMTDALVRLGFETRDARRQSLQDIAQLILDVASKFRNRSHVDPKMIQQLGREIPETVRQNPIVRMPGHIVLLGRVLGLLSGVSRSLGSNVDLLRTVLPYTS